VTTLLCDTCAHWQPSSDRTSSYAGACALQSYPGRVTFDMSCDKHSSTPQPAPTVDMQSQARGIYQMWGPRP